MTKQQLIQAIKDEVSTNNTAYVAPRDIDHVLGALASVIAKQLAVGVAITIPDVGKFNPTERKARTGRNPQTGEPIEIPAKFAIAFKPLKGLKDAVAYHQTEGKV